MLFCLCATSGYAQRADVAKSTKEQKQEAKAVQGDILFKTAVEAIKARNFVWEFYNPRSTDKSKVCYNFMRATRSISRLHGLPRAGCRKDSARASARSNS